MSEHKKVFRHSRPAEQVGIVWTYGSLKETAMMFDRAEELDRLLQGLVDKVNDGILKDEDVTITLKADGEMGGTMTVEWKEMTPIERLWQWVKR